MRKQSLAFLEALVSTPGPSGFEVEVQKVCADYAAPYVDRVYKDVHGNQFHVKNEKAELRIMLAGHIDEIGLMVNHIDDKGFIRFVTMGGFDAAILPGQRVVIQGARGEVPGAIGRKPIHLMDAKERAKAVEKHEMWIDIGARDRKEAERLVAVGDCATLEAVFQPLRDNKAIARAFDDRVGAFVILETMRLLAKRRLECAVYAVTTVQEEVGLRGARTSCYGVDPHAGVAVDVGFATDHPRGDAERFGEGRINGGPILHRGPNINPVVEKQMLAVAKKSKIPYQIAAASGGTGTDANAMQLSRGGVATGLVSIPTRYMHSPVELISLKDAENAARLLAEWLCTLKPGVSFIP